MNEGVQQIRMSSNIEYIGVSAFDNCIYLETIEFDSVPQTTVSINDKAFAYCYSLKEVQLPASVLFGNNVFEGTELDKDYPSQYNSLPATTAPLKLLKQIQEKWKSFQKSPTQKMRKNHQLCCL